MIPITSFAGKRVAVFGLGGSGLVTAEALVAGGADVVAWDDGEAGRAKASAAGIHVADLRAEDWSGIAALVLSPGVPLTHPEPHWSAQLARAAGVEIIGDIELFCRERAKVAPEAPFVAITGTNGKSTTTALIAHILKAAGRDVQMGGNIGRAILSLDPLTPERVYVIECSSFQIDLAPSLAPTVGVLLNLTPDHLDRHGTMEHYAAIKERLVARAAWAVVGVDDEWCEAIALRREKAYEAYDFSGTDRISASHAVSQGMFAQGTDIVSITPRGSTNIIASLDHVRSLRGAHNAQNACAAIAAIRRLGISARVPAVHIRTFPGLAHRMEEVGRIGATLFINDSKATNADSTEKALAAFPGGIHWIVGGKPKEGGIASLASYFPRIAHAYLIGVSSDDFAATLDGKVPYTRCETLENALTAATENAARSADPQPVVLLSPACASYDQFPNFEARGDRFRDLVLALPGLIPATSNKGH
ncbi:UDP-N-acetylmuramoyl-L-alanine--D-glutamate ligase [Chelatococcus asaccharovorans]|uniref:UDP-N-acetylmuramoylalanine--D-glutamate ligase n=1 Tax=Chelatococcus asaccharovorans TaxID=28210 RepID=A0A2V3U1Z0_9HYPH|nr:UDP-N-acetylmuramoyl-L-alanine--D-glutamate ligase [Chelatococcus asaccharovorans]MBS7704311.1 UDP-N-acetylmuramoyl-L-alanine--D-glutamate ligase [Chelatococcus asaccharovorans]PXW55812.1 UDP-N-acetylmuramoylalanine--D-glutamate ligase [Chelatococcus asaccharovorans]